ncbi:MAG: DUF1810 domain-containing protein [Caulobacteraceae bacterium]|nr:DUF1810 domain-containing protein [Caulobacteraceae bacterium]
MNDPHDLERFVSAQAPVIARVEAELAAGAKASHWMWFVFPQIAGLGSSQMAQRYAIASRAEAGAYLAHPVLGSRLRRCVRLVLAVQGRSAREIFGATDAAKFRSCLTLFEAVEPRGVFAEGLERYFGGERDPLTLERI